MIPDGEIRSMQDASDEVTDLEPEHLLHGHDRDRLLRVYVLKTKHFEFDGPTTLLLAVIFVERAHWTKVRVVAETRIAEICVVLVEIWGEGKQVRA